MQIILQVVPALVAALQLSEQTSDEAIQLQAVLSEVHASLEPMHPGTHDTDLSRFFTVEAPDGEASALRDALLQTKGVTAAYFSPQEEMPE